MTATKKLINGSGNQYFPQTHTKAVVDDNGYTAESRLAAIQDEINNLQEGVVVVGEGMTPVPSDLTPTSSSSNWVTSGGIYNAIDVVKQETYTEKDVPISSIPSYSGYAIYASTDKWYKRSDLKYLLLSVSEGDVIKFKGNASGYTQYAYLHSNTVVSGSTPDYATNTTLYTLGLGEEKEVTIPSGTAYLYFLQVFNSDRTPEYVKKNVSLKESLSETNSKIDSLNEEITDFTTKTISISTTKNTITTKLFDFVEGRKYKIKMIRKSGTGALALTIQASPSSNNSHFDITSLADGATEKEIVWTANSYKYIGLWSGTGAASVSLEITWSIPEEINEINNRLSECELVQKIKDSYFIDVEEDGLYFVDKYLHVGAKIDGNGLHAININENNN